MMRRILTAMLCLILAGLCCAGLWSCNSSPAPSPTPSPGFKPAPTDEPTEEPTEAPTQPEDLGEAIFTKENLAEACIVIGKNSMLRDADNGYVYSAIVSLQRLIKQTWGVELAIIDDSQSSKAKTYEILIGETNRRENGEKLTDLLLNDYGYVICGTKIMIKGGGDSALKQAVGEFTTKVIGSKPGGKKWVYAGRLDTVKRSNYLAENATLNGVHISQYSIVYPENGTMYEQELAERLANRMTLLSGYAIEWYSDKTEYRAGSHEILIGKTNRACSVTTTAGAALESSGSFIAVVGSNAYEYGLAQSGLSTAIEQAVAAGKTEVVIEAQKKIVDTTTVSLMGYNIYGVTNAIYQERADNLCRLVTKYLPGIVAFQEPASNLMNLIHMEEYYGYYMGIPRHGADVPALDSRFPGANSYGPILYAKDRFEVIEGGTKWMTSTPDVVSKLDQSEYYRIYTYAMFLDKTTNEKFIVVNHHLDFDPEIQMTTMKYMYQFFNENYTDIPVIMAGDMNANAASRVISELVLGPDSCFKSLHTMASKIGTQMSSGGIDWIFATSCCVSGVYFTMCHDTYRDLVRGEFDHRMPSDHPATYAEFIVHSKKGCTHNWTKEATF